MRIQFYPSSDLTQKLEAEALKLDVNVSTLVKDLLNRHYGLIPATNLSEAELEKKIFEEVATYVNNPDNADEEFDLNKASETYRNIEMVYAGKPNTIKARIGKKFNNNLVGKIAPFDRVYQIKINGKPKRSPDNRAAMYAMKHTKKQEDYAE